MHAHSVFHLYFLEVMKKRLPTAVLTQILGDPPGKKDVASVAAIHDALGHVDAGAGYVFAFVDIDDLIDRPAVNAHPQFDLWPALQSAAYLHCALDRSHWIIEEDERHAVAGGDADYLIGGLRPGDFSRATNYFLQRLHDLRLLVGWQL